MGFGVGGSRRPRIKGGSYGVSNRLNMVNIFKGQAFVISYLKPGTS